MNDLQRITERYLFDRLVGSSASGSVFRAVDNRSGRTVAVKLFGSLADEAGRERFLAVARALQRLDHPSLPTVLEAGFTGGGAFLVTDYLQGTRLDAGAELPPARLLALLLGVVDGLEAMAAAGVAHGNLRADNLLVTAVAAGEAERDQVKILGLGGTAGPWSEESGRIDLYGLATLGCRLLGAMFAPDSDRPPVSIPSSATAELSDPDALRALLETLLRRDTQGPTPDYDEVRRGLRLALFGTPGSYRTEVVPPPPVAPAGRDLGDVTMAGAVPAEPAAPAWDGDETQATPLTLFEGTMRLPARPLPNGEPAAEREMVTVYTAPIAASPGPGSAPTAARFASPARPPGERRPVPAAPPPEPRLPVRSAARRPRWLWPVAAGVPLAALAVAAAALFLAGRPSPPEPRPAPPVARPPAAPVPLAHPPTPSGQAPQHPQLDRAAAALAAGDAGATSQALAELTPDEKGKLDAAELARYDQIQGALVTLRSAKLGDALRRGLQGDLPLLHTSLAALPKGADAELTPEVRRSVRRARLALDLEARLTQAERDRRPVEVIRQAAALLAVVPRFAPAQEARERAAAGLETQADAAVRTGQPEAALGTLETLREAWPDRPGLAERIARLGAAQAETKENERLEGVLAAAARAEAANQPQQGLKLLADAKPSARYADRFQKQRERLEELRSRLDRSLPVVKLGAAFHAEYEKGKAILIPLRITDESGIRTVECWARAEGGRFQKLAVPHLTDNDYQVEIPPDLHQDKTVEFYVVALDELEHRGQLGSPEKPEKMRRKSWLSRFRTPG